MTDKSNLKMIIQALTVLDRSMSGDEFIDFNYKYLDRNSKHGSLLVALFNSTINNTNTIPINQYVQETFDCFRKSKRDFVLILGVMTIGKIYVQN